MSAPSERMRTARENLDPRLTQEDVGEAVGLTQSQVSNIENGRTAVIGLDTLRRWLKVIRADANHIFGIRGKGDGNGKSC